MDHAEKQERTPMKMTLKTGLIMLVQARLTVPLSLKIYLCALGLTASTLAHAEQLGRLFFTPEQRALLERGQQPDTGKPENIGSIAVGGVVQKHGGERTVWINGVPQVAGKGDEKAPESVPVTLPGKSQPVRVKVGQKVLLDNPSLHKPAENKPSRQTSSESDD